MLPSHHLLNKLLPPNRRLTIHQRTITLRLLPSSNRSINPPHIPPYLLRLLRRLIIQLLIRQILPTDFMPNEYSNPFTTVLPPYVAWLVNVLPNTFPGFANLRLL
jgi:hypothetical protein